MNKELASATELGFAMVTILAVTVIILTMLQLATNAANIYENDITLAYGRSFGEDLKTLSEAAKPVPAALAYATLLKAGDSVTDFELYAGGTPVGTNIGVLENYFDKKVTLDVQESSGFYKVRAVI